jgi:hypothetical protein
MASKHSTDPNRESADALRRVLARLHDAEAEIEALTTSRTEEIKATLDREFAALGAELDKAQQMVAEAGEAADRRLRQSVDEIRARHAEMQRDFDEAMQRGTGSPKEEARGLLGSISRAVRDSLLNLGGSVSGSTPPTSHRVPPEK